MIKLFDIIDNLGTRLFTLCFKQHKLKDYRIVVGVTNNIVAYLRGITHKNVISQLKKDYSLASFLAKTAIAE